MYHHCHWQKQRRGIITYVEIYIDIDIIFFCNPSLHLSWYDSHSKPDRIIMTWTDTVKRPLIAGLALIFLFFDLSLSAWHRVEQKQKVSL